MPAVVFFSVFFFRSPPPAADNEGRDFGNGYFTPISRRRRHSKLKAVSSGREGGLDLYALRTIERLPRHYVRRGIAMGTVVSHLKKLGLRRRGGIRVAQGPRGVPPLYPTPPRPTPPRPAPPRHAPPRPAPLRRRAPWGSTHAMLCAMRSTHGPRGPPVQHVLFNITCRN